MSTKHQAASSFRALLLPALLAGSVIAWQLPAAEAASVFERVGKEFAVNTTRTGAQVTPSVAPLAGGGFAIVWTDHSVNPDRNVRARLFSPSGAPPKRDFIVHREREGIQEFPRIAGLEGGGFVAIWYNSGGPYSQTTHGQRFSNAGTREGRAFRVDRVNASGARATVAPLENGGFVTAWDAAGADFFADIYGQSYRADGRRSGAEFRANRTTPKTQNDAAAAGLSTGDFVATWTDSSQTASNNLAIRAQVFAPNGGKSGNELIVNRTLDWSQSNSSVAPLRLGRFVVVWQGASRAGGDSDIHAQILRSGGSKLGPENLVGRRTEGNQQDPAVAGFPNGRFVVVWTDENTSWNDNSNAGIRAQIFSADGTRLGLDFQVNRTIADRQENPAVAVLDNRRFVVVWTDHSGTHPDTSPPGIRGQIFRVTQ